MQAHHVTKHDKITKSIIFSCLEEGNGTPNTSKEPAWTAYTTMNRYLLNHLKISRPKSPEIWVCLWLHLVYVWKTFQKNNSFALYCTVGSENWSRVFSKSTCSTSQEVPCKCSKNKSCRTGWGNNTKVLDSLSEAVLMSWLATELDWLCLLFYVNQQQQSAEMYTVRKLISYICIFS